MSDIANSDIIHDGGQHNGPVSNFLGLTFYIKNIGTEVINYQYAINIQGLYKGVDKAIRIAVVTDDETCEIYSKGNFNPATGEYDSEETYNGPSQLLVPAYTTPFLSQLNVVTKTVNDFLINEYHKYTVLIWIEGNDPECTDDIKGGSIKLVMTFKIV